VNDLFGVPMGTILVVLVGMLLACLGAVGWVAWRRPVVFKLGVRNLPRRPAQTVLIVAGLMLSTLNIGAALGVGDTIDYSLSADVYDNLGEIDEFVVPVAAGLARGDRVGGGELDAGVLGLVERAAAGDPDVAGVMPLLEARGPVAHEAARSAEPEVVLVGLDPGRLAPFGGLVTPAGEPIRLEAVGEEGAVLSARLAEALAAEPGDRLILFFGNRPVPLTVAAVAADSYLSGVRRAAGGNGQLPGLALPLGRLQAITGQEGRISAVAVSNAGDARRGLARSDAVVGRLEAALAAEPAGEGLAVDPVKADQVAAAERFAEVFTSLFLVLGLFSIAAGVLLIVLIFTMLAAERRPEMGMARAVGAQRGALVQQFVAEGAAYALIAGLVGAALGVAAALGIAQGMTWIFGEALPIVPHVSARSPVIAYCLGVVITLATVAAASWRISRLGIVGAIRDIPDAASRRQRRLAPVWAGLLLVGGVVLIGVGRETGEAFPFTAGVSLLPFAAAIGFRVLGVPGRPLFSLVGGVLLVFWLLPDPAFTAVFGEYRGEIEMFFLSGLFMVLAATILVVNNLGLLLAALQAPRLPLLAGAAAIVAAGLLWSASGTAAGGLGETLRLLGLVAAGAGTILLLLGLGGVAIGRFPRLTAPSVRTAIAYPGATPGRTGLTVAMFGLIVFSLVMTAAMTRNFADYFLGDEANAGWDVRADAFAANPIADFRGTLAEAGVETGGFRAVGRLVNPSEFFSQVRLADGTAGEAWKRYPVYGVDAGFLDGGKLAFAKRAEGYGSDAAVLAALRTEPDAAFVDAVAVPQEGGGFGGEEAFRLEGLDPDADSFAPIAVEVARPDGGPPARLRVIAVLEAEITSLFGLHAPRRTVEAAVGPPVFTSYLVALDDPRQAAATARAIEAALLRSGVQASSIRDQLAEQQRQFTGFLSIIQGFMGLGILVGVAAVGVIAFRSVVERRQQIGVLRAIGYSRGAVALSFLVETAFVVLLGALAGTTLGLILARNLFASDQLGIEGAEFTAPWGAVALVLALTTLAALLMTWLPARQAARLAPAEALRYE